MNEKANTQKAYNGFEMGNEKEIKRKGTFLGDVFHRLSMILWFFVGLNLMYYGGSLMFDRIGSMSFIANVDSFLVYGFYLIFYYFFLDPLIKSTWKKIVVLVIFMVSANIFVYYLEAYVIYALRIITGIIGFVTAFMLYLNTYRQIKDHVWFLSSFLIGTVYLLGAIFILFDSPRSGHLFLFIGLYLFFFGFNLAKESLKSFFHIFERSKTRKRKIITLPTAITAFMPISFFASLSNQVEKEKNPTLFLTEEEVEEEEKPELVIYVHTRAGLVPGFGHVDIALGDKVYCFGNYDDSTWKLGGFWSDGVMIVSSPEAHIYNSLTNDKKVLVAFGVKITPKMKKKLQKQIDKIMSKSYRWYSKAELAARGMIEGKPEDYTDVASTMYNNEPAEFYKFKKGSPYKTYFLLGQNCSMVANDIVGKTGTRMVKMSGIITPGAYLQYLNELYMMGHTIVTERKLYMLNNNGKPYLLTTENEEELGNEVAAK